MNLECFCPAGDALTRRVLEEYGAMFVAEGVSLPPVCVFETEEEVESFQREAGWRAELDGAVVELQPAAMEALLNAREEAAHAGLAITPRGGTRGRRGATSKTLCGSGARAATPRSNTGARRAARRRGGGALRVLPCASRRRPCLSLKRGGIFFSKDLRRASCSRWPRPAPRSTSRCSPST
jgi:hypothetical protein